MRLYPRLADLNGNGWSRPREWGAPTWTGTEQAGGYPNKWDSPRFPPMPTWTGTEIGSTPAIGMPPIPAFSSDPNLGFKPPIDFGNPIDGTSGGLATAPPIDFGSPIDGTSGGLMTTDAVKPPTDFGSPIGGTSGGLMTPPLDYGNPIQGTSGGLQTGADPFGSAVGGTSGGLQTTAAPTVDESWYEALKTPSAAPANPTTPIYTSALAGLQQQPQNNDLSSWLAQMRQMGLNTGSSF